VQDSVYEVFAVKFMVDTVPEVGLVPVHPPLAVQLVAFVELHVSDVALPDTTDVGLAWIVTVGTGVVQLSPGCLAPDITLSGVQVLSDFTSITLSTFTPALRPKILAV
jgi:hypothetical protein